MTAFGKYIMAFLGLAVFSLLLFSERSFLFGGVLGGLLLTLSYIDFKSFKIPDWINALIFISGILYNIYMGYDLSFAALSFLIAGLSFYFLSFLYLKIKGRQGLGGGDIKLFAAGAIWLSPFYLPLVLLISSLSALLYAVIVRNTKIPYGPFLGFGIWISWIYGSDLLDLISDLSI